MLKLNMFFFIFFINLILTLMMAIMTLIERKVLALVQRSVGPDYIGYKGRFQFMADALKLLSKKIFILNNTNKFFFMIMPIILLFLCYCFWLNLIWGPNLSICEIEYNILFFNILSLLFSFFLFLIGWISGNKYSILSSNRMVISLMNLEIFLNFIFLFLIMMSESFSFYQMQTLQNNITYNIFIFLPMLALMIILFLLETARIPFDLSEAESELIAGYTTEFGGFFFALFYLGEYFGLYCFSMVYSLCFLGGWNL